jgi:hypothetical protein
MTARRILWAAASAVGMALLRKWTRRAPYAVRGRR